METIIEWTSKEAEERYDELISLMAKTTEAVTSGLTTHEQVPEATKTLKSLLMPLQKEALYVLENHRTVKYLVAASELNTD